jgi:hypothetical protein
VVALFALAIYGIASDFRLGMATNLEPLRSFSYLLGVSASLMLIPLVLLCTPQVLRTHYFIGYLSELLTGQRTEQPQARYYYNLVGSYHGGLRNHTQHRRHACHLLQVTCPLSRWEQANRATL